MMIDATQHEVASPCNFENLLEFNIQVPLGDAINLDNQKSKNFLLRF